MINTRNVLKQDDSMSSLSMVEAKLPPGFRFHPRDDELVCDYLLPKWNASDSSLLTVVDLNKSEPWDIPERACIGGKEWYFYSQRDRKYATGLRTNRATVSGYWKATGKDRAVVRRGTLVGMRKTLVFYQGRAPKGRKTEWVMHEFRVEGPFGPPKLTSPSKEDWVLCRVFFKNKDTPAKSGTENNDSNNSIDEATESSSVAPLMDSYITFDQPQPNANANADAYQQVPCFSMFSANQNNNNSNNNNNDIVYPQNYQVDPTNNNGTKNKNQNEEGDVLGVGNSGLSPITCDKRVLEAVLRNLTKMETCPTLNGSPSVGVGVGIGIGIGIEEAPTSQTYLSQLALQHPHPTMWTHY